MDKNKALTIFVLFVLLVLTGIFTLGTEPRPLVVQTSSGLVTIAESSYCYNNSNKQYEDMQILDKQTLSGNLYVRFYPETNTLALQDEKVIWAIFSATNNDVIKVNVYNGIEDSVEERDTLANCLYIQSEFLNMEDGVLVVELTKDGWKVYRPMAR